MRTIEQAFTIGENLIGKRESKILLSHVTGYSMTGVVMNALNEISDEEYEMFISYVQRRQAGEPVQYIIGQWEFMGLSFKTDKRALIPRPETELLVEEAFSFIKKITFGENTIRVLDVCTGSGCIAIVLARLTDEFVHITATDISPEALSLARENAQKNYLCPGRINFIETDLIDGITEKYDVIISNPPYIKSCEMKNLPQTVLDHEPHIALDGGVDGLDFYRRLIPQCKTLLNPGGALFLEIGPVTVKTLMCNAGFENINMLRDYAEIERVVSGHIYI